MQQLTEIDNSKKCKFNTASIDDVIVAITNIVVNTTIALSVKFSTSK